MTENNSGIITPKTRVGELLDTYPHLEPVLLKLAPAFAKLKNPILRKTVGKVATLQQAAAIGNMAVSELVNALRTELGQELFNESNMKGDINYEKPDWYIEDKVTLRFDATKLINKGDNPMLEIFQHLDKTGDGDLFMFSTPFVPAPIIELISKKGYAHYCRQEEKGNWSTYILAGPKSAR